MQERGSITEPNVACDKTVCLSFIKKDNNRINKLAKPKLKL